MALRQIFKTGQLRSLPKALPHGVWYWCASFRLKLIVDGKDNPALAKYFYAWGRGTVAIALGYVGLKELAALVSKAKMFIGMDSVPMHMASAMRTPTVAMFGPSGEIEWGPWRTTHRIVTSTHSCRPCGINGCGGSNRSECLETIEVSQVLAAVDGVLERARAAQGL